MAGVRVCTAVCRVTRRKIPEPSCRGKRDLRPVDDCDVRRPTADNRDVGGRTSNVERPKRGEDFPGGRPIDITTESTESTEVAPRSPKDQGAEARSGENRALQRPGNDYAAPGGKNGNESLLHFDDATDLLFERERVRWRLGDLATGRLDDLDQVGGSASRQVGMPDCGSPAAGSRLS